MINKKPNIVLIVIDALRARNLGIYGYHKDTSPTIDTIGKEGVVFNNAYCCFNATDPSITSILTGMYPLSHGILHHGFVSQREVLEYYSRGIKNLAEILRPYGYTTIALDWLERWHKRGFDYYGYYGSSGMTLIKRLIKSTINKLPKYTQKIITGILMNFYYKAKPYDAEKLTNHAINLIKKEVEKQKPFFIFIHYWDVHLPYNCPKDLKDKFIEEIPYSKKIDEILAKIKNEKWRKFLRESLKGAKTTDDVIARYDGAIAHVDGNIGRLIDFLDKCGILDNTLLIITSDHGESLTEHDIYFDHHGLYDVSIHVPLIMRYPQKLPERRRIEGLVQHIDIVPTILDIINIRKRKNIDFDGKSMLPLIEGKIREFRSVVFVEESSAQRKRAIRTKGFKYIQSLSDENIAGTYYFGNHGVTKGKGVCKYCGFVHGDIEELYDLKKDPHELINVVNTECEIALKMRKMLHDIVINLETMIEKRKIKRKCRLLTIG